MENTQPIPGFEEPVLGLQLLEDTEQEPEVEAWGWSAVSTYACDVATLL